MLPTCGVFVLLQWTYTDSNFEQDYNRAAVREAAGSSRHGGDSMDPVLGGSISSSTMYYLPFTDSPVVIQVICAAKPSLCLANDLVDNTVSPIMVS